ncbi:putative protein in mobD 3'region [Liparis tanakae]|uniref:Uncharacterized protein n=1 Tax=Liparis tanakae TaxID=230148 RepID=A0A4Z2IPH3_9TELE|nr:putative protein in mobD 3'region [Liparis tanakae]
MKRSRNVGEEEHSSKASGGEEGSKSFAVEHKGPKMSSPVSRMAWSWCRPSLPPRVDCQWQKLFSVWSAWEQTAGVLQEVLPLLLPVFVVIVMVLHPVRVTDANSLIFTSRAGGAHMRLTDSPLPIQILPQLDSCMFRLTIPVHVDNATEELTFDLSDPWTWTVKPGAIRLSEASLSSMWKSCPKPLSRKWSVSLPLSVSDEPAKDLRRLLRWSWATSCENQTSEEKAFKVQNLELTQKECEIIQRSIAIIGEEEIKEKINMDTLIHFGLEKIGRIKQNKPDVHKQPRAEAGEVSAAFGEQQRARDPLPAIIMRISLGFKEGPQHAAPSSSAVIWGFGEFSLGVSGPQIEETQFWLCNLPNTNLLNPNLPNPNLPNTNLPNTNLPNTNLLNTNLPNTNLPNTNLPNTNLPNTNLPNSNLLNPNLLNTNLLNPNLLNSNLLNINLLNNKDATL